MTPQELAEEWMTRVDMVSSQCDMDTCKRTKIETIVTIKEINGEIQWHLCRYCFTDYKMARKKIKEQEQK